MLNSDPDIFYVKIIWVGKYRSEAVDVNLKWGIPIQDRQTLRCRDYIFREGFRKKSQEKYGLLPYRETE